MALTPKEKAAALREKIIAKIDEKFSPPESQQIKRFVQYFYQVIEPEDMLEREDVSNLYGVAVAYWRFARQYTPEQTKVLVYNPQFEQDGWQSSHTVVSILIKDMPFLVDSIRMALNQHGLTVHFTIHPVLKTRRDEQGQLLEVLPYNGDAQDALAEMEMGNEESIIHLEVDRQTEAAVLDDIARELEKVLNDVSKAVDDWQAMREKMSDVLQKLENSHPPLDAQEINEVCDFLRWAQSNHFIFLGYREYELSAHGDEIILYRVPGSGLGILRDQISNSQSSFAQLPLRLRKLALQPTLLLLNKTSAPATIHRPGHLDYIGIKRFNQEGVVTGEQRFLGLYTSAAYHQLTSDTPLIRRKIKSVFEKAGFRCTSHKKRALSYILETYPRDELFQIDEETLFQTTMGILQLQERQQRIRLFVRPDTFGRFFSCLVYVSRDRYETEIRQRIQKVLLEAFGGSNVKFSVWLSELVALTQIHFIIYTPTGSCPDYDIKDIEKRLIEVTLTWSKMLQEALLEHNGEEVGTRFFIAMKTHFQSLIGKSFLPVMPFMILKK